MKRKAGKKQYSLSLEQDEMVKKKEKKLLTNQLGCLKKKKKEIVTRKCIEPL